LSRDLLISLVLLGWFVLLAVAETANPHADEPGSTADDARLVTNFGLAALILLASGLYPLANVGAAALSDRLGIGLAQNVAMPWLAILALMLIAQTFASYWVHRLMHQMPILWRIHRVHHADRAVDVSTSLRNHPFELLVTLPVSSVVVLAIGAPVSVVVAFQAITLAAALWQHADIDLPQPIDRAMAILVFTPRLHRLHHNPMRVAHDSNFGELFTIWDRLFGTYAVMGGRGRVGLDDQVARPDHLLEQIWSPLRPA
jgi:sterol desaturase/sphingolipid hydroxylase (fatty acid hydroxylase superfamily)